jgi:hypothetical protein
MDKAERKREKARLRTSAVFGEDAGVIPQAFGSTHWDPKRNAAFMSATGFNRWAGKHPKISEQYTYEDTDIDDDGIPEAIVKRAGNIVGVNGWELKPSRANYERDRVYRGVLPSGEPGEQTDLWSSRAQAKIARNARFFDEDLKDIRKRFGKQVVKPVFAQMFGKDGAMVKGAKRTASYFTKQVIKLLVENELDTELLEKYARDVDQGFRGWREVPDARKAAVATLHHSKEFKQVLKQRLDQILGNQGQFVGKVRGAIDATIQLGNGQVDPVLAEVATINEVPEN